MVGAGLGGGLKRWHRIEDFVQALGRVRSSCNGLTVLVFNSLARTNQPGRQRLRVTGFRCWELMVGHGGR